MASHASIVVAVALFFLPFLVPEETVTDMCRSKSYFNYIHQAREGNFSDDSAYSLYVKKYGEVGEYTSVAAKDASLLHFWMVYRRSPRGSEMESEARKELVEGLSFMIRHDENIKLIVELLFGMKRASEMLNTVRPADQPFVIDRHCDDSLTRTYMTHCGMLVDYGVMHDHVIANLCNAGIQKEQMEEASTKACPIPLKHEEFLDESFEIESSYPGLSSYPLYKLI